MDKRQVEERQSKRPILKKNAVAAHLLCPSIPNLA